MTSLGNHVRHCSLLVALALAGCVGDAELEDLGTIDDGKADSALPREVEIALDPGESRRFRITTKAFVATLSQPDDVDAELTAKYSELEYASDVTADPRVEVAGDGASHRWTLTVYNRGDATLDATLLVDKPRDTSQLGIVSDIDKTVMPPEVNGEMPAPYPGIAKLLATLELRAGGSAGDVTYVTARTPDAIVDVPDWMATHDVPAGRIETGISGVPWVAENEKVADISRVLDARGEQRFVLFGDTSHRDPEVYKRIRAQYPMRIAAIFIHKVNATVTASRVEGMHLVDNYAHAAAEAFGDDLITETEARAVITKARTDGLVLTDAQVEALLDANR